MRTPRAMYDDWWIRRYERRASERKAREFEQRTGHKNWGDDFLGTALAKLDLGVGQSLDARRLAALPPGVELGVREVKEAWRGVDGPGPDGFTLHLLQSLVQAELVSITTGDDGWRRVTVPEGLHERLKSRWPVDEAGRWHDRLLDNARKLVNPGDGWWDLPADAGYWWRHLVWHLWHCDPEAAAGLVTHPRWQTARIQRFEVQGLLTDLALVNSRESRATASTVNEVISGKDPAAVQDPGELAQELLRALGLSTVAAPSVPWPQSAVRAVLRMPPSTRDFALSPDGTWLVAVGKDKLIRVYDLATQAVRSVIHGPYDALSHCAIAPDGSFFMAGTVGEKARAWNAVSGKERHSFPVGEVWKSVQSPDGTWISYDMRTGNLGNPLTGKRRRTNPKTVLMTQMALTADGGILAMGNTMGDVWLWDPRSGQRRAQLPKQPHEIHRLGLAANGSWIAIGDLYEIRILELPSGRERFTLKPNSTVGSTRCAISTDWLAVPDHNRVQIRSTRDGALLSTLDVHKNSILDCRLSPDGRHLMTLDNGDLLMVWDATALVP